MGTLRFGLAMLVVYFHVQGREIFDITLPDGRLAVQLFYLISGFYMALILNEKYRSSDTNALFYSNRFFRLWPPMMVVMILVAAQFVLTGEVLLYEAEASLETFLGMLAGIDFPVLVYLAFTNLFVLGQDWIWFFRFDASSGVNWCPVSSCAAHNGSSFLMNHPTFTVAIEATFYLMAPFVLRRSFIAALALVGLGAAWHAFVAAAGLDPLVWGYHFVASAAFFFFLGACAYHAYARSARLRGVSDAAPLPGWMEFPTYVLAPLLAGLIYATFGGMRDFVIALVLALVIPLLFARTRTNRLDRAIGELSYGIYLIHFPLYLLLQDVLGFWTGGIATLVLVVPAAMLLYVTVERPVDRWRQRRARAPASGGSRARRSMPSLRQLDRRDLYRRGRAFFRLRPARLRRY